MKTIASLSKAVLGLALASCTVLFVPAAAGAAPEANAAVASLPDFTDLVDKAGPAVVNIRTTQKIKLGQNQGDDDQAQEFFRRFFGVPMPQQPQQPQQRPKNRKQVPEDQEQEVDRGIGSGFIISVDGYVLTNAHVVDGADEVHVTMTDKREFKAKVIGADKQSDIALLKIDGTNLPHLPLGDSDKIRAGEWAIAIGSPFNLDNTVTAGIISSKARDIGDYLKLIQTDVAVNPGNSGGPLLNMRGEVVGINSQIFSESGGYMGISFAVPINDAIRVSEQLKASGKVAHGRLGVQIQDVTREVAESLNLPKAEGASVARVEPGSPAEKGGIQAGDIVIKYNGTTVESVSDLRRMAGGTKPGTKATVTVWRKGASRELNVVIAELDADKTAGAGRDGKKPKKDEKPEQGANALGLTTSDLSDEQKKELGVDHGVLVESAEGAAQGAGLRPGDVIQRVKDVDITDSKQFNALVAKLEAKKAVAVLVTRNGASQFVLLKPAGQ
ncbi:MAG: DegQ family serine endoprotease [Burkholderiaceae bacterium]|nr:DegQ family serine endoprotease [Burkholderiaceae bacterium]